MHQNVSVSEDQSRFIAIVYKFYIKSIFQVFHFLRYTALFIILYNAFPSLSLFLSASFLFYISNSANSFSHCDLLSSSTRCIFISFNPSLK